MVMRRGESGTIFRFAPNGKLASETIYYDRAGVLNQVGLYHEPVGAFDQLITGLTHLLALVRAYVRKLFLSGRGDRP